ncbi:hypothetical protein BJV78DRAFT_1116968, partial [Lactifluus subvellereus]
RPVLWTSSAILFAHESEPVIVGRAFPSSKQFLLQPSAVGNSPSGSYEPPSILSVSLDENWLFAYFPGRQVPGVGCFWRAHRSDNWDIVESISFARGRGVVSAMWLGHAREWVTDTGRNTSRLPPLGPAMLSSLPALVLITQNLQVQLCYVRSSAQESKVTTVSCSLSKHDEARDTGGATSNLDSPPGSESRSCTHAAIGLGYNETAILVATRSRAKVIPLESSYVPLGLDEAPDLSAHFHDVHFAESTDWESWAQEPNIELCEVRLGFDGFRTCKFSMVHVPPLNTNISLVLSTIPLPPLRCSAHPLSSLMFCPGDLQHLTTTESSSGSLMTKMYLCLSLIDFGKSDSTIPKSELVVFGFYKRERVPPHANISEWVRLLTFSETLAFILPRHRSSRANTVIAGSLSTQGPAISSKRNALAKVPSGSITVLQLPSLDAHSDWGSEPLIMGWSESSYGYPPLSVALSPNAVLLCAVSQSTLTASRLTVHSMPKKLQKDVSGRTTTEPHPISDYVSALVLAVRSKRTISDVAHQLSLSSVSVQQVESVLCEVLETLESHDDGLRDVWFHEFLGTLLEVYRLKGERMQKKFEKEDFRIRWKTIQDLCSVMACHSAFEDCMDGDSVGLDNIWPLVVLSTWFMEFLEELMRECILLGDSREGLREEVAGASLIFPSIHPILLNLLSLDALVKLRTTVRDVKQFYDQLKSLDPNGENGAISKNALLDTVDTSGINLETLDSLLTRISKRVEGFNAADVRRSIAACNPVPKVYPLLWEIAQTISKSNAVEKSRLFIKPLEFVSEIGKVRKTSETFDEGQDIVSKGILLRRRPTQGCVRCGGKTQQHEVGPRGDGSVPGSFSFQWQAWGRRWSTRCICGGRWVGLD